MSERLSYLVTTFDGGGNIPPAMSVVERLVARGHGVRVMSNAGNRQDAEAAGASFIAWRRGPEISRHDRDIVDARMSIEELIGFVVEGFMCGQALSYAQDVAEELDREPADLVVNSDFLPGVMVGCEACGQRQVVLSTNIAHFPFELPDQPPFGRGLAPAKTEPERAHQDSLRRTQAECCDLGLPALNAARAVFGLAPLEHVFDQIASVQARFLATAHAFDFPSRALPANVHYVGPLMRDPAWALPWHSPWPSDQERPLILVAFSTGFQDHAVCLQRVIEGCAQLRARVLVTLGGSLSRREIAPAANTEIVESAPHSVVMRDAALVVTHGGHGTVMNALTHGLPMVLLPHGRDQADNAVRVTERGAGLSLPNTASSAEVRAAVSRLLDEPAFRLCAERLGNAVAAEAAESNLIAALEALARDAWHGSPETPMREREHWPGDEILRDAVSPATSDLESGAARQE